MKRSIRIFALLAIGICFAFALPKKGEPKKINVLIDAGHGGKDYGAVHNAFTEKEITNQIAAKIMAVNSDKEIVLHFTREDDAFVDLNGRVEAMNTIKPDLVLSLHVNYTNKEESPSGMEFFVCKDAKEASKSIAYANKLSDKFENKGYKVAELKYANFYTLTKSEVPTVVMELGYLSNEIDRAYLTNNKTQDEIAGIVADFLKEIK